VIGLGGEGSTPGSIFSHSTPPYLALPHTLFPGDLVGSCCLRRRETEAPGGEALGHASQETRVALASASLPCKMLSSGAKSSLLGTGTQGSAHLDSLPWCRSQATMAYHSFLVEPISCHAWNKDRTRECCCRGAFQEGDLWGHAWGTLMGSLRAAQAHTLALWHTWVEGMTRSEQAGGLGAAVGDTRWGMGEHHRTAWASPGREQGQEVRMQTCCGGNGWSYEEKLKVAGCGASRL
jgi:hypothetical protein